MARSADVRQLDLLVFCEGLPLFPPQPEPEPRPADIIPFVAQAPERFTLADIVAQETAKRVLEIALAGGHSVLFVTDPGAPVDDLARAMTALADDLALPDDQRPTLFSVAAGAETPARADLVCELLPTHPADLANPPPAERTSDVARRIGAAWVIRSEWEARGAEPEPDPKAAQLFAQAVAAMNLDTEQQERALNVARTVAALAASSELYRVHVAEALSYIRPRRRDPEPPQQPKPPSDWPEGAVHAVHPIHAKDDRPYWKTNAHEWGGEILAYRDRPAPMEIVVRGVRTVIVFGYGMATHAVDAPGTPYWSETGFRSFTCYNGPAEEGAIRAYLESYIDAPMKDGNGCGGKLAPWWTCAVRQLQQERHWAVTMPDRRNPDRMASLEDQVRADGFDPDVVAPWPAKARQRELI